MKKVVFLLFCIAFTSRLCKAAEYTLATSGNWNVASNWLPTGVPGFGDKAVIGPGKTVTLTSTTEVSILEMTSSLLDGNSKLNVLTQFLSNNGSIKGLDTIIVYGNAVINGGYLEQKTIIFKNEIQRSSGQFFVYGNGYFIIDSNAVLISNFTNNNANLFLSSNSSLGIGYVRNYGTIIKNNSLTANIAAGFPNGIDFVNFGKIQIEGGELYMLGLSAEFMNDTIHICGSCKITMVSYPNSISTYTFSNTYADGNGKFFNNYPGSVWHINAGSEFHVGIEMNDAPATVYDNFGLSLNYLFISNGKLFGNGNTIVQDSFYMTNGVVGENGSTGTVTVNGNAQLNGGSIVSKTIIFNEIVNRASGVVGVYYNGIIRFSNTSIINLNFTSNQTVFTSNQTLGTVENYGVINKHDNRILYLTSSSSIGAFSFYNFGTINLFNWFASLLFVLNYEVSKKIN